MKDNKTIQELEEALSEAYDYMEMKRAELDKVIHEVRNSSERRLGFDEEVLRINAEMSLAIQKYMQISDQLDIKKSDF